MQEAAGWAMVAKGWGWDWGWGWAVRMLGDRAGVEARVVAWETLGLFEQVARGLVYVMIEQEARASWELEQVPAIDWARHATRCRRRS